MDDVGNGNAGLSDELLGCDFGDIRLCNRLLHMAQVLEENPSRCHDISMAWNCIGPGSKIFSPPRLLCFYRHRGKLGRKMVGQKNVKQQTYLPKSSSLSFCPNIFLPLVRLA
jgi:hypothetical protein